MISPVYFISRYPDIEEKYSSKDIREILDAAKEVVRWAGKKIK